jgi:peptidoglycan glycosyltransferase
MGRRIRWLGLILVLCFGAVLAQLVNIQVRQATALDNSRTNPRNLLAHADNQRGLVLAANGKVLAQSLPVKKARAGQYQYVRNYPTGPLYSGVTGYDSTFYGTAGVEYSYNTYLWLHKQPARTLGQLLNPPTPTTDNVTLTIQPVLQELAQHELASIPDANQDGAIVLLDPKTGAVLADYSSPTFTNNALATPTVTKEEAAGKADFTTKDHEGFQPGYPLATYARFAPGSTFKVVTTSAVYNLEPSLANFTFKVAGCTAKGQIPQTTKQICNDATTPTAANPCGGGISVMLPESCDPGYAMLGLAIGGPDLYKQAELFGFNRRPPIDIGPPTHVVPSYFPAPATLAPTGRLGLPGVALSAFGQQTVSETALQNAMVAAGIADTGKVMTPHVMAQIRDSTGALVKSYTPTVYEHAESAQAARTVIGLMEGVVNTPRGTAYGVGFPKTEEVAVKTGTAQAGPGNTNTTDWMIGLAPASDPVVAIAVAVPYQARSASGASIAGPIVKAMIAAALAQEKHGPIGPPPPTTTSPGTPTTAPATTAPATTAPPAATTTTTTPTTTTTIAGTPPTTTTTIAGTPPTTTTTTPGHGAPTPPGGAPAGTRVHVAHTTAAYSARRDRPTGGPGVRGPP